MKKRLFAAIAVVVFVALVMFNINVGLNSNIKTDVTLGNVEALAKWEVDIGAGCMNCETSICYWIEDDFWVYGEWL